MDEYDKYNDYGPLGEVIEQDKKPLFRLDSRIPAEEIPSCLMLLENFYDVILWDFQKNRAV